ncbi:6032_t:CDS:2, partial [Acaulospora colombiana]
SPCNFFRAPLTPVRYSSHEDENSISFRGSKGSENPEEKQTSHGTYDVEKKHCNTQPYKLKDKLKVAAAVMGVSPSSMKKKSHMTHPLEEMEVEHYSLHSIPSIIVASPGENGKGHLRHGAAGKDIIIPIPLGTIIREIDSPSSSKSESDKSKFDEYDANIDLREAKVKNRIYDTISGIELHDKSGSEIRVHEDGNSFNGTLLETDEVFRKEGKKRKQYKQDRANSKLYLDLSVPDVQNIVASGGEGGKGNPHFVTNANRSPTFASRGKEGQKRYLELEVKTIADVGLVGLPNAGKSTFLSAVSNAHPKVAPYPFTTLNPFIGTVDFADRFQLTVADIPGLIKDAHKNVGLGHSFLRHIERSKVLVYVVDLTSDEPWEDLGVLMRELEQYKEGLTKKPSLLIANKADVTGKAKKNLPLLQSKISDYRHEKEPTGENGNNILNLSYSNGFEFEYDVIPVSAKYHKNIVKATSVLRKIVERVKAKEACEG